MEQQVKTMEQPIEKMDRSGSPDNSSDEDNNVFKLKYNCKKCGSGFSFKQSFHRHNKLCAGEKPQVDVATTVKKPTSVSKGKYICENCQKEFPFRQSVHRHKKSCKGKKDSTEDSTKKKRKKSGTNHPYICESCKVVINNRFNFITHLKVCNGGKRIQQYKECFFPSCKLKFYTRLQMIYHLKKEHMQDIDVEELIFHNEEDFKKFKKEEDAMRFVSSVKPTGSRKRKHADYEYYACNFDVQSRPGKNTRIPPNLHCPARMLVRKPHSENETRYEVKIIRHHNHKCVEENLQYQHLQEDVLDFMKTLLVKGVPPRQVRDELVPPNVHNLFPTKESFLTIRDVRQLSYRMQKSVRLNQSDAESVRLLVDKLNQEENSILIYKPQGTNEVKYGEAPSNLPSDLFILGYQNDRMLQELKMGSNRIVCVDATHNTNRYRFQLLNMVVPDEYGVGYPVAHFILSATDAETLKYCFNNVKRRCPNLRTNALMTDDDKALCLAYKSVFGEDVVHLLCTWHVDTAWTKQLHRHVKDPQLFKNIKDHLDLLRKEKNSDDFLIELDAFLDNYSKIKEAESFIEYFVTNYKSRCKLWALCFRNFPHAKTDTNMFVESFHAILKKYHLKDRVNTRVDDLMKALFAIEWDKFLDLRKKRSFKVPPIGFADKKAQTTAHLKGLKISDEHVRPESEQEWKVQSQSREDKEHSVILHNEVCSMVDHCFIKCTERACPDLCVHLYACSCEDTNMLCKHIHKVHSWRLKTTPEEVHQEVIDEPAANDDEWRLHTTPPESLPTFDNNKASRMTSDCKRMLEDLKEQLDDEAVQKSLLNHTHGVLKQLSSMFNSVRKGAVEFPSLPSMAYEKTAPNQKKEKQTLFRVSKKREAQTTLTMTRATKEELFTLKKELLGLDPMLEADGLFDFAASTWAELNEPKMQIGNTSISMIHLKSLFYNLSDTENNKLIFISKNYFKRGHLYDSIIDAFCHLVVTKHDDATYIESWLIQCLCKECEWTEHLSHLNIQGKRKIFIPCNPTGDHWILLYVHVPSRTIYLLDPLLPQLNPLKEKRSTYSKLIVRWRTIMEFSLGGSWTTASADHMKQKDSENCGVFVCWFIERISARQGIEATFKPCEYRKYMMKMICQEGLKNQIVVD